MLTPHWWLSFATGARKIPRPTWSISQAVAVEFYRRVSGISELAGCQFETRDVTTEPDPRKLKETRFEWAERMQDEWIAGVLHDEQVCPLDRVGMFVWEKHAPGQGGRIALVDSNSADETDTSSINSDSGPLEGKIGIYLHGGGELAPSARAPNCFEGIASCFPSPYSFVILLTLVSLSLRLFSLFSLRGRADFNHT